MSREQFLNVMYKQLSGLPEAERREYLTDFETHFAFGEKSGKTEDEIVSELGNPYELAMEILGDRKGEAHAAAIEPTARTAEASRSIFAMIGIFFISLFAVPMIITMWAVWFSLAVTAWASILSPIVMAADAMLNQFYVSKMFLSIALVGVGILLWAGVRALFYPVKKATIGYFKWTVHTVRGVNRDEKQMVIT